MYTVYILKCADGEPYTGCTENLEERLARHSNGYVPATENRRPVELVTHIVFSDKYKAFEFEKYLKSGSGGHFSKNILPEQKLAVKAGFASLKLGFGVTKSTMVCKGDLR